MIVKSSRRFVSSPSLNPCGAAKIQRKDRKNTEGSRQFMKLGGASEQVYLATNRREAMNRRKVGSL